MLKYHIFKKGRNVYSLTLGYKEPETLRDCFKLFLYQFKFTQHTISLRDHTNCYKKKLLRRTRLISSIKLKLFSYTTLDMWKEQAGIIHV